MLTHARIAALAVSALTALGMLALAPSAAQAAGIKAGVAEIDASWHVGAAAGQYASDGTFASDHGTDPNTHSVRRQASYGRQSELKVRALVIEGPDGKRIAVVKNDLYLAQDSLHRRTAQLLEQAGTSGVTAETLTMAATHNHSSPYYSSPSWGVWAFQDVFDIRFFAYYARKQAEAVERAAANMKPVRVGGAVEQFDKTHRNSIGGAVADDGSPAGYPVEDTDHDMFVVRFDDISDPADPKPLANLVNFPLHPEFLDGNDLISADYVGPLQRMADRETGAMTILTQGSVGTAEPERSTYHSIHERLEFTHKEYAQADYGARLMADKIVEISDDIEAGTPAEPDRFVPFTSDAPVQMKDKWYPGPASHPYPGVSNCRTDRTLGGEPQVPIVGLPDCASTGSLSDLGITPPAVIPENPITGANPGINTDTLQRAGVPVPENYSAPSYTGLEEDLNVHLQAFRIGEILFTVCSCEQWKDQGENIETRTDRVEGNQYNGYDWSDSCTQNGDGTYGGGAEGYGDGTWNCAHPNGPLNGVADHFIQKMRAQVNNPANGWNDLANAPSAESEPTDVREIKGNFTHDDDARSAELGYTLTVPIAMANDYNGYIASYREYQRGDHYRKALTGWGPHSADYLATRLVTLGRLLRDPGYELPQDQVEEQALEPKVLADNAANDARTQALGEVGVNYTALYEEQLPDDAGAAEAVTQPEDVERFGAALFTWNGGSNYTDSPDVRVQREVGDSWRDYADGSGEVPITLKFPQNEEVPAHETGSFEWEWTAHFEAFVAGFDLGDRPRATPPGTYRFVVRGERRSGGEVVPYEVESREFTVTPWSGVTVDDLRVEDDGRVSFEVGPRSVQPVVGGGGPEMTDEIGPIDYPDTYDSPARFIDDVRTFMRDPAAPADADLIEWFCLHCSWRPWADAGDAEEIELTFAGGGGAAGAGEPVAAQRSGDRWVSSRALLPGESAYVGAGCARDAYGNFNGAASTVVGAPLEGGGSGEPATRSCAVAAPGDGDGDPGDGDGGPGDGDGGPGDGDGDGGPGDGDGDGGPGDGDGGPGDGDGDGAPGGSGDTPGAGRGDPGSRGGQGQQGSKDGRSGDQRTDGQGQRGGDRRDGRRGRARGPRCARPTGRLRGRALGRARLGRSRAANRRAYPRGRRPRRRVDRFCLTDGRHVRVGYPSSALLARMGSAQRRRMRGRAVFVASASRRYTAFGKRHGSSARGLRGRRFRVGRNVWVVRRARRANVLFKVRGGRVREVGLADRRLTATRAAAARYLRGFD